MADFLDEKRREIGARIKELAPLVEEFKRLQAAADALDGVPASAAARSPAVRSSKAPDKQRDSQNGAGRRGRPKGTGTRAKQALTHVTANPGITIADLAEKMGIKQNYLYRVMPRLAEDGRVRRDGRGWYPNAGV